MKEIKTAITKLTNHISKQETRQVKKPSSERIRYMNALTRARNELLVFKGKHKAVLDCIL